MIEASLAGPVTDSLDDLDIFIFVLSYSVIKMNLIIWAKDTFLLLFIGRILSHHVNWLTCQITTCSLLLASIALFSSFEVIVVTSAAVPATIGKIVF